MRDTGTFCVFLPLKLGAGLACMLVFASSLVCILGLLTSDIRFRSTGYNLTFHYFPEITGVFGIVFGFLGLLGTYDDKWNQLWWFNRYFLIKLAMLSLSIFADFMTLQHCEVWKNDPDSNSNPQLLAISERGVCSWARWSYAVGCSIDLGTWLYLFSCCYSYEGHVRFKPSYEIDFRGEKYDLHTRWDFYKVKDPRMDRPLEPTVEEEEDPFIQYGAVQEDGVGRYGPDGMRVPRARQHAAPHFGPAAV